MDSYDILVIVLSVALAISIFIWIWIGVLVVQILKKVREASDTAKHAVENVEEFTAGLKNVGKASAVGSVLAQIKKAFKNKDK
jgi:uncharacterized protein YoxC